MPTSNALNGLIPLFDLTWWQLFLIFLIADWGIILAIKFFEPLGWKRSYWRSSIYGDIFLPIGIASAIIVTQHAAQAGGLAGQWYASPMWNWTVFAAGWLIILGIEIYLVHPRNGHYQWQQIISPSKIWHTLIFPFMFYFSAITLIPLFATHQPLWAFILALAGYGGWAAMYASDLVWPPDFSRTH